MTKTHTVHIDAELHRVLRQMAAYEETTLQDVMNRVLRFALNLSSDTRPGQQQDLVQALGRAQAKSPR
jgi:hypothetical protein